MSTFIIYCNLIKHFLNVINSTFFLIFAFRLQQALRVEKGWQDEREKCHAGYLQIRAKMHARLSVRIIHY